MINGIVWKLHTGAPWRDLPERYDPWQTCADRLYRWWREGAWDRILAYAQTRSDAVGEVIWEVKLHRPHLPPCQWRTSSAEPGRRKKT